MSYNISSTTQHMTQQNLTYMAQHFPHLLLLPYSEFFENLDAQEEAGNRVDNSFPIPTTDH